MAVQTVAARPRGAALIANSDKIIRFGGLAFVALAGFAGAFRHMHDWTAAALPGTAGWLCWANAVISEIMPAVSFLSWRDRMEQRRKAGVPLVVFLGSSLVSLVANLTAAGLTIDGAKYFLAALPMLAVLVLFKMVLGDLDYARKEREQRTAEETRRAELARKQQVRDAELAAEQTRNFEREQAELAAELALREQRQRAELDRQAAERAAAERIRLAEIEQAAITRREEREAQERLEIRQAVAERDRRNAEARAAAIAEAERIKAEAEAEVRLAEAERIRVEAAAKEQAAALLRGRHRADAGQEGGAAPGGTVSPIRRRRSREETEAIVAAALAMLPAGTSRDDAVKAVAGAIGNTERYAREFVPADWVAASSGGGEPEAA